MSAWFNYSATLKILLFGLLVGAGLPALFALGVRLQVAGSPSTNGAIGDTTAGRRPALLALGWAVFALVLAVALLGVLFISRDFVAAKTGLYLLGAKPT